MRKRMLMILLVLALSTGAILVWRSQRAGVLTVTTTCAPPQEYGGISLGHHVKVVIQGDINVGPGVWTLIKEEESGQSALISYQGGDSVYRTVLRGFASPIRGKGGTLEIKPGKTYRVEVWQGAYTTSFPNLGKLVAQTEFSQETCPV